ncbi:STAS domain-containing protein [Streptomyces sp. ISL-66]|uniref:STAS domain-containing protein n=1 Tax=Streptomyces sp. ISL-66 TaxID=2819186 RepID=UPI001BE513DD|nr:STAS domain-containing protein [Streptomyces sp. ISL-66]MBT2467477.1 STAS domain-containing protein [Streptomyces sp. ISL-66]
MVERPPREPGGRNIAVEVLDGAVAVRPVGEVDIETAPVLQRALAQALTHASPAKAVVIDCSRLTFCDSSALNALLAARRAAEESGTVIRLAAPQSQLQRLLEITGATALFPVEEQPPPPVAPSPGPLVDDPTP